MVKDSLLGRFYAIITEEANKPKGYDALILSSWEAKNKEEIENRLEDIKISINKTIEEVNLIYTLGDLKINVSEIKETIVELVKEEAKKPNLLIIIIVFHDTPNLSPIAEMFTILEGVKDIHKRIIYCSTNAFEISETILDTLKKKRIRRILFENEESLKKKLNHAILEKINELKENPE